MDFVIKKAEPGDFGEIYLLMKAFADFIKTPDKLTVSPGQMVLDKDYFNCFIALHNEKIVGFASYFIAYYSWSGKAVYLDDLYVTEEYRGYGIGNKLFDKVVETARTENCIKVRWQVSNWNKKAIEFYKRKGAAIDEIEINCELKL